MEIVGFIGLGNMGSAIAARIQKAGHALVVYDLRERATLPFRESGAEVAVTDFGDAPRAMNRGPRVIGARIESGMRHPLRCGEIVR